MNYRKIKWLLWGLIGVTLAVGAVSLWDRVFNGHANTNYGSYVPWGLWVAQYVYFISLSAGAFLLSTLVYVFRMKSLEPVGRLALFTALVALVASITHVFFDLGRMERFWHVYFSPNWGSMMNFMVWSYSLYFLLLLGEFFFAMRQPLWEKLKWSYSPATAVRDGRLLRILASIGIPLAISFHGGVGALFGVVAARPYWHVGMYPVLFLVAAAASGAAFLAFILAFFLSDRAEMKPIAVFLGKMTLLILVFETIFLFADYFQSVYQGAPANERAVNLVLTGQYAWAFWGVQVFLGTLVPIALLVHPRLNKRIGFVGFAGLLVVIGFFVARLNLILPGMAIPEFDALETAFVDPRLSLQYFPSLAEWGLSAGIVGFTAAIFLLGFSWLPLVEKPHKTDKV